MYNASVKIISYPIFHDNSNEIYGALALVIRLIHPIIQAFDDFAPVISNMFTGGCLVYITDSAKITHYQQSPNWDYKKAHIGNTLETNSNATKAINSKKQLPKNP